MKHIYQDEQLNIEIDADTVCINGVLFAKEVFQYFANPDPSKFYQMTRDGERVILSAHSHRLASELDRLYAREQNVKIWSDWDAQWNVALGDDLNGYTEEERGLTLEEVVEWLSVQGK